VSAQASAPRARWSGRQFHNQPLESHTHRFLADLWNAVREETGGALDIAVHAQNAGIAGSDPQALSMLVAGELEFQALMGGILGKVVPAAEIQAMPFAFASHAQAHLVNEGRLGEYLDRECAAKGIHRFRHGTLENGFRQLCMVERPIRTAEDLRGVKMRVPDVRMSRDLFAALEALPVTVNISGLYEALRTRRVDGQENPLVITEVNRLYEVTRYVSISRHMWSGFNLLANLKFWRGLPAEVQDAVQRNVKRHVARQRAWTDNLNRELEEKLAARGMIFNVADVATFRRKLGGFYESWKREFGATLWGLLEDETGRLG